MYDCCREALVASGRCARPDSYGETMLMLCKKLLGVAHAYLDVRIFFLLLLVPAWCMDVCRNVDSFPFRQIFVLPIYPNFRRGHAEFFRRPCMSVYVLCMLRL